MMIQMVIVLCLLESYVVVMSDEVKLTATIPPGYGLQDYLYTGVSARWYGGARARVPRLREADVRRTYLGGVGGVPGWC